MKDNNKTMWFIIAVCCIAVIVILGCVGNVATYAQDDGSDMYVASEYQNIVDELNAEYGYDVVIFHDDFSESDLQNLLAISPADFETEIRTAIEKDIDVNIQSQSETQKVEMQIATAGGKIVLVTSDISAVQTADISAYMYYNCGDIIP